MKCCDGDPAFKLWLLGDSPPRKVADRLRYPLDPRHPTRNTIVTPVFDRAQQEAFRHGRRIATDRFYVRNAVSRIGSGPTQNAPPSRSAIWNGPELAAEIAELAASIKRHRPLAIFSFGAFAAEFVRRARCSAEGSTPLSGPSRSWTYQTLGGAFKDALGSFATARTNLVPLLHQSIALSFDDAREGYCQALAVPAQTADGMTQRRDYFAETGKRIGAALCEQASGFDIRE